MHPVPGVKFFGLIKIRALTTMVIKFTRMIFERLDALNTLKIYYDRFANC